MSEEVNMIDQVIEVETSPTDAEPFIPKLIINEEVVDKTSRGYLLSMEGLKQHDLYMQQIKQQEQQKNEEEIIIHDDKKIKLYSEIEVITSHEKKQQFLDGIITFPLFINSQLDGMEFNLFNQEGISHKLITKDGYLTSSQERLNLKKSIIYYV